MRLSRRRFLGRAGAGLAGWAGVGGGGCAGSAGSEFEARVDVFVAGGGLGGCAAALAALEAGCRVGLSEESDWLGGQASTQGVPPDEHPWIEEFGRTRAYRDYRESVRAYYRAHFPLSAPARADRRLNPGNGWVSALCHEPWVSAAVFDALFAPHAASGRLKLWREAELVAAAADRDRIEAVTLRMRDGRQCTVSAQRFIDATELGELLSLARVEHVVGAESRRETGEPHASEKPDPDNQQSITWCFAMEHRPGENHAGDRPADYAAWRGLAPEVRPPWPGPLLGWAHPAPGTLQPRALAFDPTGRVDGPNLWTYRRIRDAAGFLPDAGLPSVTVVNWPQNDYWLKPIIGGPPGAADCARRLSAALLYWLQTEAPRPDGGAGWPGLRPCAGVLGTSDGFAKRPYIRESRRIRAVFTVKEQHVAAALRPRGGAAGATPRAEAFPDSVGVGAYRLDLHPTASGQNYVDMECAPFQIPLGSLIPERVENLLAGGKNLGVTHVTNGCFRLHPVEWNIGEAAGAAAAMSLRRGAPPRALRERPRELAEMQRHLVARGVELAWPESVHPL